MTQEELFMALAMQVPREMRNEVMRLVSAPHLLPQKKSKKSKSKSPKR